MIAILNAAALILLSLLGKPEGAKLIDSLEDAGLRRLILEGDVFAAEEMLLDILGKQIGVRDRGQLEQLIPGGIGRLLPAFSAIALADRLVNAIPAERKRESAHFVENGHFRKFGVTGKLAPALLAASLQWMEGSADEAWTARVKKERRRIARETERLLRPHLQISERQVR